MEDQFKPLQVGITNPTPAQQSGNISPTIPIDDGQRSSRPTSSSTQQESSPKTLPSPDTAAAAATATHVEPQQNQTIQNLPYAVPLTPGQTPATTLDYEQGLSLVLFFFVQFRKYDFLYSSEGIQTTPSNQNDLRLGEFLI